MQLPLQYIRSVAICNQFSNTIRRTAGRSSCPPRRSSRREGRGRHRRIEGDWGRDRAATGRRARAVVVNYASSKSSREGGRRHYSEWWAVAVRADLAKEEDVRRLFAETKREFGNLDVLVNNAGIYEFAPIEAVTAEHFHRQFNLNVLGLVLATQEAVKQFGPAGGSIINISSVASTARLPNASVYSGTKGRRMP